MKVEQIDFALLGDERGRLTVIEENRHIPFPIKRVYYIYDTLPDVIRGCHAHRKLKQIAIVMQGSCDFILDDGHEKVSVHLDSPTRGLVLDEMVWHEMHNFAEGTVLMVLASDYYDESDYIRDYDAYLKEVAP